MQGALSPPLVAVIVSRDVILVVGGFVHRARMLRWRWPGLAEFFRLQPGGQDATAAPIVKPLLVSKVNTALQFLLIGAAVGHEWQGLPADWVVTALGGATAATTVWSSLAYWLAYRRGTLLK